MSLALSRLLIDRFFSDVGGGGARPATDWKETPEAHVFKMDLPGLRKEQVAVEVVDSRMLRVRGGGGEAAEKGHAGEDEDGGAVRWHCREGLAGAGFVSEFRLPEDAAADEVRAGMADGVLTVTVPKRKGAGKKRPHGKAAAGDGKAVCCRFWP